MCNISHLTDCTVVCLLTWYMSWAALVPLVYMIVTGGQPVLHYQYRYLPITNVVLRGCCYLDETILAVRRQMEQGRWLDTACFNQNLESVACLWV